LPKVKGCSGASPKSGGSATSFKPLDLDPGDAQGRIGEEIRERFARHGRLAHGVIARRPWPPRRSKTTISLGSGLLGFARNDGVSDLSHDAFHCGSWFDKLMMSKPLSPQPLVMAGLDRPAFSSRRGGRLIFFTSHAT
jgi:hypothetical protein